MHSKPVGRRSIQILAPAALLFSSLLFGALVSEVVIRLLVPQQLVLIRPDIWMPRDTLGWAHQPLLDTEVNTGERTVRLITDANGFRVGAAGRSPGRKRVLLLGDSFMAALQVEHEQSFAALLEEQLSELLGEPIDVWNTGVGAWDPPQYRAQAEMLLPQQHFDVIVTAVFLGNDVVSEDRLYIPPVQLVEKSTFSWPQRPSWQAIARAWLRPINDRLEGSSHLFVFLKRSSEVLLMRVGLTGHFFPSEFLRHQSTSNRWDVTANILSDIRTLADDRGLPAVFLLVPSNHQVDEVQLSRHASAFRIPLAEIDVNQPNERLRAALHERGIAPIDPLETFRRAHQNGTQLFGLTDPHLSPEGHALLAEIAVPEVAAALRRGELSARD